MKSFFEFLNILEDYRDINAGEEEERLKKFSNASSPPLPSSDNIKKHGVIAGRSALTRGFHLNTIASRMMQPWVRGLTFAPLRNDLVLKSGNKEDAYKYRMGTGMSVEDKAANNKYKAAYSLFRQEIANAINAAPEKIGFDLRQNKNADVLSRAKDYFSHVKAEEKDLIESLRDALNIYISVFGYGNSSIQVRNMQNFLEIVAEEFMIIPELLPSFGDEYDPNDLSNSEYVKILKQEIERLKKVEKDMINHPYGT